MHTHINPDTDIAVIGMAGIFPDAPDVATFWNNLTQGKECITAFDPEALRQAGVPDDLIQDPAYIPRRGIIDNPTGFDAYFFDYAPNEAEIIDPQQRLFMETAWKALEDAACNPESYEGLIGLFGGVSMNTYLYRYLAARGQGFSSAEGYQLAIGNDKDFLTTRLSYKFNLRGPSVDVQTACSTSLVSVVLACQNLLNYSCDMALAGGASVTIPQEQGYMYQEGMILSPDGHCRPFDAKARGTISGNGVGVVVLKRAVEALEDGDHIYAIIKGAAYNNDGAQRVGYTAPSVDGQADVIATAQALADVSPDDISYVECHGTGTEMGDPIEITALKSIFAADGFTPNSCAIGSVKSNIGHLDAAAGIAGFIKAVLCLYHKKLVPTLHYQSPNPQIDFDQTPFYVNTAYRDWPTGALPRLAAVSSFGIGGTNAHVIVQEAPVQPHAEEPGPHLLCLSAKTTSALDAMTTRLADHLENNPDISLADTAYTLLIGRKHFSQRRMVCAVDKHEAVRLLRGEDPQRLLGMGHKKDPAPPQTAFLFSGQGSQYPLMGKGLYERYTVYRQAVDQCADLLKPHINKDIRELLYPKGDMEKAAKELNRTEYTQPALFVTEYALARLWASFGIRPRAMAGHSIGEYVAAHLAGVFSLEDALKLVARRGALMQSLPTGSMLSVPLDEHDVRDWCTDDVVVATVNSKGATVLSGPETSIRDVAAALREKGIESRLLHTSHAFHSPMMTPILDEFEAYCRTIAFKAPTLDYLSNVSGTWITAEEATDPAYYARHLRSTVRFYDNLTALYRDFKGILLECGPGKTLQSFATRHPEKSLDQVLLTSMRHPKDATDDVIFFMTALGRFWLAGQPLEADTLFHVSERRKCPLPTYPFEKKHYLLPIPKGDVIPPTTANHPPTQWFYTGYWKPDFSQLRHDEPLKARRSGVTATELKNIQDVSADEAIVTVWQPDPTRPLNDLYGELANLCTQLSYNPGHRLIVVSDKVFRVLPGEEGVPHVAALTGLLRSFVVEESRFSFTWIDTDDLPRLAPGAFNNGIYVNRIIALRGGQPYRREFEHINVSSNISFRTQGHPRVLITGGTGQLGALWVDYISKQSPADFYLLSRNGFPPAEQWPSMDKTHPAYNRAMIFSAAEKRGSRIRFITADMGDTQQLDHTLNNLDKPDIIIHAAGLVGEAAIHPLSQAKQENPVVFDAKVNGTNHLIKWARDKKCPLVILQSSLSAELGGYGFSAYATANAYMDQLTGTSDETHIITINWDGWRFDTEDTDNGIPREAAVTLFDGVFSNSHLTQIIVSTEPLRQRMLTWQYDRSKADETVTENRALYDRPNLPTAYVPPENDLQEEIAAVWQNLLGIGQVGIHDDFFDLGGNSLMGTQLISRMRERFKVDVPVKALFENPTIAGVSALIEAEREKGQKQEDVLADMLNKVENMSPEQIAAMLNQQKKD